MVRPTKPRTDLETSRPATANGSLSNRDAFVHQGDTQTPTAGVPVRPAARQNFHDNAQVSQPLGIDDVRNPTAMSKLERMTTAAISPSLDHAFQTLHAAAIDVDARARKHHSNDNTAPMSQAPYRVEDGQQQPLYPPSSYAQYRFSSLDRSDSQSTSIASYTPLYPDQQKSTPQSDGAPDHQMAAATHNTAGMPLYPQDLTSTATSSAVDDRALLSPASQPLSELAYLPDYSHEVSYAQAFSMPVFNHETALMTPFVSTDDFATWLLDPETSLMPDPTLGHQDLSMLSIPPELTHHIPQAYSADTSPGQQWPLPLSPKPLDSSISAERRKVLNSYIIDEFRDQRRIRITLSRNKLLAGDHEIFPHMMSLQMLQACLGSYWTHIDHQYPVLHRPTFDPNGAPDLLVLTQIALGASCLDATYGHSFRQTAFEWANFLVWHIRYKIYQEYDFGPPAKLWVFQTMLLLELFEKMYSTRELHERAHVHHATTIALMKRGGSLQNLSESAAKIEQPHTRGDFVGSVNMSGSNTTDTEFNKWISAEAMKRVAFMAFYIDTMHATIFGHVASMMPHEIRIRMPCDEDTWSATSFAEVKQRMHEARQARGNDVDITFEEALKRTLNGRSVQTTRFGRIGIMAGLLSLSWHLKLRDVHDSSVGIGKKGNWAPKIFGAIDFWKHDFDSAPIASTALDSGRNGINGAITAGNIPHTNGGDCFEIVDVEPFPKAAVMIEYSSVLHHLAHMTMHCDMLDYQIYAGATVALGRNITSDDRQTATRKVRDIWAPSASGRDAVWHALRFLSETLLCKEDRERYQASAANGTLPGSYKPQLAYHPRNDVMVTRPWVLYIAVMVVWSYGYALDGVIPPSVYVLTTQQAKTHDLYAYLLRVGGVATPAELAQVHNRNRCLGLLMVVRDMMRATRWELLHDAAASLKDCILLLMPGMVFD